MNTATEIDQHDVEEHATSTDKPQQQHIVSDYALITFGWWGYFICALIYVIQGIRFEDYVGTVGSIFFLLATAAFLVPHHRQRHE